MNEYVFDDKNSIIHVVLGFITVMLPVILGTVLFITFVSYEVHEHENAVSTIGDVVEYLVGLVLGLYWFVRLGGIV